MAARHAHLIESIGEAGIELAGLERPLLARPVLRIEHLLVGKVGQQTSTCAAKLDQVEAEKLSKGRKGAHYCCLALVFRWGIPNRLNCSTNGFQIGGTAPRRSEM